MAKIAQAVGIVVVLSIRADALHYDVFCNLAGRFGYIESSNPRIPCHMLQK